MSRSPSPTPRALALAGLCAGLMTLGACTNPEVPAGYEGYIYHKPLVFGAMEYRDSLVGPASTSVAWRLFSINIDMRERNYSEKFQLLSKDDLQISFDVHTRIRLRPGSVRQIVEQWGGVDWYEWNVKERLRTAIRTHMMTIPANEIQSSTAAASARIKKNLEDKFKDTPFEFVSVDIGSFVFPGEVDRAIQEKIAKEQELERQNYLLEVTRKQAAIDVFEAIEVSKRQRIIGQTLDPLYVQWQAVQVYRELAASQNKAVVMLPNTTEGTGVPKVVTNTRRKTVTDADMSELESIEAIYQQKAAAHSATDTRREDTKPAAPEDAQPDQPAPDGASEPPTADADPTP